ncbi:MAG: ribonuclease G, partial [Lactobacillaceae bacterium]
CLIPLFNVVWIFVCGFKGNEWAWQKGDYKDVETFKAVQSTWNRAGLVNFIISIAFLTIYFIFIALFISSAMNAKTY